MEKIVLETKATVAHYPKLGIRTKSGVAVVSPALFDAIKKSPLFMREVAPIGEAPWTRYKAAEKVEKAEKPKAAKK